MAVIIGSSSRPMYGPVLVLGLFMLESNFHLAMMIIIINMVGVVLPSSDFTAFPAQMLFFWTQCVDKVFSPK